MQLADRHARYGTMAGPPLIERLAGFQRNVVEKFDVDAGQRVIAQSAVDAGLNRSPGRLASLEVRTDEDLVRVNGGAS